MDELQIMIGLFCTIIFVITCTSIFVSMTNLFASAELLSIILLMCIGFFMPGFLLIAVYMCSKAMLTPIY